MLPSIHALLRNPASSARPGNMQQCWIACATAGFVNPPAGPPRRGVWRLKPRTDAWRAGSLGNGTHSSARPRSWRLLFGRASLLAARRSAGGHSGPAAIVELVASWPCRPIDAPTILLGSTAGPRRTDTTQRNFHPTISVFAPLRSRPARRRRPSRLLTSRGGVYGPRLRTRLWKWTRTFTAAVCRRDQPWPAVKPPTRALLRGRMEPSPAPSARTGGGMIDLLARPSTSAMSPCCAHSATSSRGATTVPKRRPTAPARPEPLLEDAHLARLRAHARQAPRPRPPPIKNWYACARRSSVEPAGDALEYHALMG